MGYVVRTTEERELACPLTEHEVRQRADRIAELHEQEDRLSAEASSAKARLKHRGEEIARERRALLQEYRTRSVLRPVQCELQLDLENRLAQWVRTDTGEVILERPLRPEERQAHLFDDRPASEGEEDEGDEHPDPDATLSALDRAALADHLAGRDAEGEQPAEAPARGRRRARRDGTAGAEAQ